MEEEDGPVSKRMKRKIRHDNWMQSEFFLMLNVKEVVSHRQTN